MLKEDISKFSKMWTWLYEHPGHDQQYYVKNVARSADTWSHNCPLSNNEKLEKCDGCTALWNTGQGSLCTDTESPLHKWSQITGAGDSDKRSYYAGRLVKLATKKEM